VLLLERGAALRMGTPSAVIAEYCRDGATRDQGDVVIDTALRGARGADADGMIEAAPGDWLTLDVTVEFRAPLDACTIAFAVRDVARDLYVYGTNSEQVGLARFSTEAGDVRHFAFSFQANLTRGVYGVELAVEDHDRYRFAALVRGACHFQVVEDVSYDGVANLYLTGQEAAPVDAVPEVRHAVAR
jgi:hypothetical protein